jgi:hypothetical protein
MSTIVDCPAQDCTGQVEVQLEVSGASAKDCPSVVVDVRAVGFALVGEHNHPDPWQVKP